MPRRLTAYAELDQLRQRVVAENVKRRDVAVALEAAEAKIEGIGAEITSAYAAENEKLAREHRERLRDAEEHLADLGHRLAAAEQRIERAQRDLDAFVTERAHDLLAEREAAIRERVARLTRTAHELIREHRALVADRAEVDRLVGAVAGAIPRYDGPPGEYEWEGAIGDLERAVRAHPEVTPPLPSWAGLRDREWQNAIAEKLRLHRGRGAQEQGAA